MKLKPVLLCLACATLLCACGGNTSSSESSSSSEISSEAQPKYLPFVEKGKIRIDTFDLNVQFSYGNAAIAEAVNTFDFNANAKFTVNKNDTADKNYNFIVIGEGPDRHTNEFKWSIQGDCLTEIVELISGTKDSQGIDRFYVAISEGQPKWTKNLNAELDELITRAMPKAE